MKFYIATRLENTAKYAELRDTLTRLGHEITYDWTTHGGSVRGRGRNVMQHVANLEARGAADADVLIVLLPGGRGTHVELGIGIGNPSCMDLLIWAEDPDVFHHASPLTNVFYHAECVTQYHGSFEHFMAVVIPYLEGKYGNAHHAH